MKNSFFKALSSQTRLDMLDALSKTTDMCVCEFGPLLKKDASTVSRHISELVREGFVSTKRDGKKIIVSLNNPELWKKFMAISKKLGDKK